VADQSAISPFLGGYKSNLKDHAPERGGNDSKDDCAKQRLSLKSMREE